MNGIISEYFTLGTSVENKKDFISFFGISQNQ